MIASPPAIPEPSPAGPSRRRILRATTGLAAAAVLGPLVAGLARPEPARANVPATPRFDLGGAGGTLFRQRPLHNTDWLLQSFAVDNGSGHVFAVADKPGTTTGDLWVTRTDLAGTEVGSMALHGFGHGVSIGVEPYGGAVYLWTESRASGSGFGTRIARFPFVNGGTITPDSAGVQDRTPSLTNLVTNPQPAIDPANDRLIVRFRDAGGKARIVAFGMDNARAGLLGHDQRLSEWALPDRGAWGDAHPFQGFTAYGQYAYLLEGEGGVTTSYLSCVDLNSGAVVADRSATTAGSALPNREPEGMAIQLVGGTPRLCFGFSSSSGGVHDATVFYKSSLV